jgi:hypothetical protein
MTQDPDPQPAESTELERSKATIQGIGIQLFLLLLFLAMAAAIPGTTAEKVLAFGFLALGILVGCGISYLILRFWIADHFKALRDTIQADVRIMTESAIIEIEAAAAISASKKIGKVISDPALLKLEADSRRLQRVVIASTDGPDEFASDPKDRKNALDFSQVVLRNLEAGVEYEWWCLDAPRASAACSDAGPFLQRFNDRVLLRQMPSAVWARGPFSFDAIFLMFKDGRTDGYLQLPSEKREICWFRLSPAKRKEFQGAIDEWRRSGESLG